MSVFPNLKVDDMLYKYDQISDTIEFIEVGSVTDATICFIDQDGDTYTHRRKWILEMGWRMSAVEACEFAEDRIKRDLEKVQRTIGRLLSE